MPDLPTISVSAAQLQRITAAFGGVDNYRTWLREQVKGYVIWAEADTINRKARDDVEAKRTEIETNFNL